MGAVARISSRLHKIKGVLRGPVEGHTFDSDPGIDLVDPEFVCILCICIVLILICTKAMGDCTVHILKFRLKICSCQTLQTGT